MKTDNCGEEMSKWPVMNKWRPPAYWLKIIMIHAGHQDSVIMTAVQSSLNTVKAIRHIIKSYNGDYEALACG